MDVLSAPPKATVGVGTLVQSPPFLSPDGYVLSSADGLPSCAAVRADGTALAVPVVAGNGPAYTAALLAATHLDRVDRLTLTFTGDVGGVEQSHSVDVDVVGSRFASVYELRQRPGVGDEARFSNERLAEALSIVESIVNEGTGCCWVPTYGREELCGDGTGWLLLRYRFPQSLISVTINGTAQTVSDFSVDPVGRLVYLAGSFPSSSTGAPNVVVEYVHGKSQPPADLRREAVEYAAELLLNTEGPLTSNVISQTNVNGMTLRYSTADPSSGRWTGHLGLDAAIARNSHRTPGLA